MTFQYEMSAIELQVFVGKLNKKKQLIEEVNHLKWVSLDEQFYDMKKYAGKAIFIILLKISRFIKINCFR